MILVVLPAHLRTLAGVTGDVKLNLDGEVTRHTILEALETQYGVKLTRGKKDEETAAAEAPAQDSASPVT